VNKGLASIGNRRSVCGVNDARILTPVANAPGQFHARTTSCLLRFVRAGWSILSAVQEVGVSRRSARGSGRRTSGSKHCRAEPTQPPARARPQRLARSRTPARSSGGLPGRSGSCWASNPRICLFVTHPSRSSAAASRHQWPGGIGPSKVFSAPEALARRYAEYASCIRPARSRLSYCAHVSRRQKTRPEPDATWVLQARKVRHRAACGPFA
jgi:hypothetical protein